MENQKQEKRLNLTEGEMEALRKHTALFVLVWSVPLPSQTIVGLFSHVTYKPFSEWGKS